MQARHENMKDVRTRYGVNSVRLRVLEKIGHVLRMGKENDES